MVAHDSTASWKLALRVNDLEGSFYRRFVLLPLLQILLTRKKAVLVGVPLREAFASGGGIGLMRGVILAAEFAGFVFVEFIKAAQQKADAASRNPRRGRRARPWP